MALVLHRNLGSTDLGASLTLILAEPGLHPCHANRVLPFDLKDYV